MKNKVILTDVDGVLLDWEYSFDIWMEGQGFTPTVEDYKLIYNLSDRYPDIPKDSLNVMVKLFNESASIGFLPPLRDAVHYVKMLHERKGYIFHAITSLSKNRYAQQLRTRNLQKLFGETIFDRFVYLDTGADKDEVLKEYEGTGYIWIEDKTKNAVVGNELGLDSRIMEHGYNMVDVEGHSEIPRVKNWKEVYEML